MSHCPEGCNHLVIVDRIDCCSGDRCFCPPGRSTRPDARPFPARSISPEPTPLERLLTSHDLDALGVTT